MSDKISIFKMATTCGDVVTHLINSQQGVNFILGDSSLTKHYLSYFISQCLVKGTLCHIEFDIRNPRDLFPFSCPTSVVIYYVVNYFIWKEYLILNLRT